MSTGNVSNEEKEKGDLADVMVMLPNNHDASVIAIKIASKLRNKLTAREECFFIAGFIECVKYLRLQEKDKSPYPAKHEKTNHL